MKKKLYLIGTILSLLVLGTYTHSHYMGKRIGPYRWIITGLFGVFFVNAYEKEKYGKNN
jgi:hypothetical protein